MNTPPKFYIRRAGQQESLLLDLNPQFKYLRFGRVEEVKWNWAKGHDANGGLYYPVNYRPGRRYPLVIQTHGWTSDRFRIEGPYTTGYGAQALAARDIFVLQINDMNIPPHYIGDAALEEMRKTMLLYRGAIDLLHRRGLIDPSKVGILGFSHTCDYVTWALTHDPALFAVAAIAGESTGGYVALMSRLGAGNSGASSLYGGPPLGQHLPAWIRRAPSFNLDRLQAPVRMIVLSAPIYLPMEWEWFEGLNLLQKPVEMVMFEGEQHVIVKPGPRMAVTGGTVDWFDFWLNGHEDPDASKTDQYSRWHQLRKLQGAKQLARTN